MKNKKNQIHKTKIKDNTREDGIYRVPRLMGTTLRAQAIRYQDTQDPTEVPNTPNPKKQRLKEELQQYVLDAYVTSGMQLNGKLIDVDEMARYIDLPIERTMLKMNRTIARVGMMMKGADGAELARVLFFGLLKKGLTIQAQVEKQAANLLAFQGPTYMPFVSSEVNKALKNVMETQKPLMDLVKIMLDAGANGAIQPFGTNDNPNMAPGTSYIGTEEALNLITQNANTLLQRPELLDEAYSQVEGQEVRANFQDLTSIGINTVLKSNDQRLPDLGTKSDIPNEVLDADDFIA